LTLTAEGATYYERTVRLLAELDDIESGTRNLLAKPAGTIRVDVGVAMGAMVIVPALADFQARYPDINIDLGIGNRDVDLVADGVDCAVRVGAIADVSLVARRIGDHRFMVCAAPAYLKGRELPADPDSLRSHHSTVGLMSTRLGRVLPFTFLKDGETVGVDFVHRLCTNDTTAYIAAGVAGLGVIQAPNYAVQAQLDSGLLVPLLEPWRPPALPISVVYPPNRFLSAKVRVFVDWIVELFERNDDLRRG
jgi:DNA-binding transcriptional LysR family regulator